MKKLITMMAVSIFSIFSLFANENLVSFSAGLSSGVTFYTSGELNTKLQEFSNNSNKMILGALGNINLNPSDTVTFFAGVDFLSDLNWEDDNHCNIFDLDFNTGIKIYPGFLGLNFGLAYSLGYRADYYVQNDKTRSTTPWGNGFKIIMEYNFAHNGSSKYLPSAGLYWKWMPRGNNTKDNNLCAYVCANF